MTGICNVCKGTFSMLVLLLVSRGDDHAVLCRNCLDRLMEEAR